MFSESFSLKHYVILHQSITSKQWDVTTSVFQEVLQLYPLRYRECSQLHIALSVFMTMIKTWSKLMRLFSNGRKNRYKCHETVWHPCFKESKTGKKLVPSNSSSESAFCRDQLILTATYIITKKIQLDEWISWLQWLLHGQVLYSLMDSISSL